MATFFEPKSFSIDEAQMVQGLKSALEPFVPKTLKSTQDKYNWMNKVMKDPKVAAVIKKTVDQSMGAVNFYVGMDADMKKKMDAEIAAAPATIAKRYKDEFDKKCIPDLKSKINKASQAGVDELKKLAKNFKG